MIGIRISETRPGLFAPGHRLHIDPKIETHNNHELRYRRAMAWEAMKARVLDGSFAREYPAQAGWTGLDLAKEPKPGSGMVDDESGIGIVGDTVNQVEKDAPPFKPTIVDDEGNVVELDADDDGA